MQNNVAIVIFEVESEAFQAFSELSKAQWGEGYAAPEAALIKNDGYSIQVLDAYGNGPAPNSGKAKGFVIGSLIGLLGGPVGLILGAAVGTVGGRQADVERELGNASVVAIVASKIFAGEIAIAALVEEEEPAFDALFANYQTTIVRYDAADIADDVERLYELEAAVSEQVIEEVKTDRKAARAERREERRARIRAQFKEYEAATNRTMGV